MEPFYVYVDDRKTPRSRDAQHQAHGDPNNGAGGISTVASNDEPLALAGNPTKTPDVLEDVETPGSMFVLAAKASPYKELDPGT